MKEDGSVVTWGHSDNGGNSSAVSGDLQSNVTQIFSASGAFAALKEDGSVVTWEAYTVAEIAVLLALSCNPVVVNLLILRMMTA